MSHRLNQSCILLAVASATMLCHAATLSAQERGSAKADVAAESESREGRARAAAGGRSGIRDDAARQTYSEQQSADAVADEGREGVDGTAPDNGNAKIPLSPRRDVTSLPLARTGRKTGGRESGGLSAFGTTLGSLVLVLVLFFAAAWILRRGLPKGSSQLPVEVVEVLGRAAFPGRQQIHLIRCGNKLLLVWATTNGVETLTEITDPLEVDRLTSACREAQPGSAKSTFRQVFQQIGNEPARGFLEPASKRAPAVHKSLPALEANDA